MKIIDVFNLMAEGKIEYGAKLKVFDIFDEHEYEYINDIQTFRDEEFGGFYKNFSINSHFLNLEVELIPPKEKKYLIKLTIRGINDENTYLNRNSKRNIIFLSDNFEGQYSQTKFTKQEMQDIQLVREFLEDMQGKYQLIEVTED